MQPESIGPLSPRRQGGLNLDALQGFLLSTMQRGASVEPAGPGASNAPAAPDLHTLLVGSGSRGVGGAAPALPSLMSPTRGGQLQPMWPGSPSGMQGLDALLWPQPGSSDAHAGLALDPLGLALGGCDDQLLGRLETPLKAGQLPDALLFSPSPRRPTGLTGDAGRMSMGGALGILPMDGLISSGVQQALEGGVGSHAVPGEPTLAGNPAMGAAPAAPAAIQPDINQGSDLRKASLLSPAVLATPHQITQATRPLAARRRVLNFDAVDQHGAGPKHGGPRNVITSPPGASGGRGAASPALKPGPSSAAVPAGMLLPLVKSGGMGNSSPAGPGWQPDGGASVGPAPTLPAANPARQASSSMASDSETSHLSNMAPGGSKASAARRLPAKDAAAGSRLAYGAAAAAPSSGPTNGGSPGLAGPGLVGGGPPPEPRSCHCKKSQCLKLYCDCFAAGLYCSQCACAECYNRPDHAHLVMTKREAIMQRDPKAFARKIQKGDGSGQERHKKGCNCKRSHCLKKYCECFQGGVKCSDTCKCTDCKNLPEGGRAPPGGGGGPSAAAAPAPKRPRSQRASAAAAVANMAHLVAAVAEDAQLPSSEGEEEVPAPAGESGAAKAGSKRGASASPTHAVGSGPASVSKAARRTAPGSRHPSPASGPGGRQGSDLGAPPNAALQTPAPAPAAGKAATAGVNTTTSDAAAATVVAGGRPAGLPGSTPSTLCYPPAPTPSQAAPGGGSGSSAPAPSAHNPLLQSLQLLKAHPGDKAVAATRGPADLASARLPFGRDLSAVLCSLLSGGDAAASDPAGGASLDSCTAPLALQHRSAVETSDDGGGALVYGGTQQPTSRRLLMNAGTTLSPFGGEADAEGSGPLAVEPQPLSHMSGGRAAPVPSGAATQDAPPVMQTRCSSSSPGGDQARDRADPTPDHNAAHEPMGSIPGAVHALVSPVRTCRPPSVGAKRSLGAVLGAEVVGAHPPDAAAHLNHARLPTSPRLDALALVAAAATQRDISDGARLALRALEPLQSNSTAMPPPRPEQPTGSVTSPSKREDGAMGGDRQGAGTVGKPPWGAAGKAQRAGLPAPSPLDLLKAQASDYINSRCRMLGLTPGGVGRGSAAAKALGSLRGTGGGGTAGPASWPLPAAGPRQPGAPPLILPPLSTSAAAGKLAALPSRGEMPKAAGAGRGGVGGVSSGSSQPSGTALGDSTSVDGGTLAAGLMSPLACPTTWGDAAGGPDGAWVMSPLGGSFDTSSLLLSPRATTPLYAKGGLAANSPFFSLASPTRWWSSSAPLQPGSAAGTAATAATLLPLAPPLLATAAPAPSPPPPAATEAAAAAAPVVAALLARDSGCSTPPPHRPAPEQVAAATGPAAADPGPGVTLPMALRMSPGTTLVGPNRIGRAGSSGGP